VLKMNAISFMVDQDADRRYGEERKGQENLS